MSRVSLEKYRNLLNSRHFVRYMGKVTKVVGLTIEAEGPETHVGALCHIKSRMGSEVLAEVVGFREKSVLLMPIGDMSGIGPGSTVVAARKSLEVGVGQDLLGRVLDGLGRPIDGKGPINIERYYPVGNIRQPHDPAKDKSICQWG